MPKILEQILSEKKKEVARAKLKRPQELLEKKVLSLRAPARDFWGAVSRAGAMRWIGELKSASPSKGWLRKGLDLCRTARLYEQCGINALSVHTDKHFKGKLSDIRKVKKASKLPVLRKDFLIDPYQIYESRFAGADAILLIAAVLPKKKLNAMASLAETLGMAVLLEIHRASEIKKIDFKNTLLLGINNRDLNTFRVDLQTTVRLRKLLPKNKIIVSESGIKSRQDILFLEKRGVNAVLVGEGIVIARDMRAKIKELMGVSG